MKTMRCGLGLVALCAALQAQDKAIYVVTDGPTSSIGNVVMLDSMTNQPVLTFPFTLSTTEFDELNIATDGSGRLYVGQQSVTGVSVIDPSNNYTQSVIEVPWGILGYSQKRLVTWDGATGMFITDSQTDLGALRVSVIDTNRQEVVGVTGIDTFFDFFASELGSVAWNGMGEMYFAVNDFNFSDSSLIYRLDRDFSQQRTPIKASVDDTDYVQALGLTRGGGTGVYFMAIDLLSGSFNNVLLVVDTSLGTATNVVNPMDWGSFPYGLLGWDGGTGLYMGEAPSDPSIELRLSILDTSTLSLGATLSSDRWFGDFAWDGGTGMYSSNLRDNGSLTAANSLSLIDTQTLQILGPFVVGDNPFALAVGTLVRQVNPTSDATTTLMLDLSQISGAQLVLPGGMATDVFADKPIVDLCPGGVCPTGNVMVITPSGSVMINLSSGIITQTGSLQANTVQQGNPGSIVLSLAP